MVVRDFSVTKSWPKPKLLTNPFYPVPHQVPSAIFLSCCEEYCVKELFADDHRQNP